MLSTVGALIGPLVGGAIGTTSTWRWVFFLKYALYNHFNSLRQY